MVFSLGVTLDSNPFSPASFRFLMNNWLGSGGDLSFPSSLSAFAPPFTAPNSIPHVDSAEGSGGVVLPLNCESYNTSWDGQSITGLSANWYSTSNHVADPEFSPYAKTSGEMNTWDLPVGVTSTDHVVVSHLGSLRRDDEVGPSHPSYSMLEGAGNDSRMAANQPGFGGSSATSKSFSELMTSDANACDERLNETAAQYPLKTARIDGSYWLEEGNLASRHTAAACNRKDVWSNEWGGPATKYPRESVRIDGNIWLVEGKLPPQRLTGISKGGDQWSGGWGGPAVEYPLKRAQVAGEELQHQPSHPEFASDIWKQQSLPPLWEQSTWRNGSNPDYENSVMKSAYVSSTGSQPDAPSISFGQITPSNGNSETGGNDEIFSDLMSFHAMKSHPLLDTGTELQFDATISKIQPDTKAFGNMYVSDDKGLPKDKFPSKNLFDRLLPSCSDSRFSGLYMDNFAGAASSQSHLAYDLATSNPWSFFHHSDGGTGSCLLDKGPMEIKSLDEPEVIGFYSRDIPIQSGNWPSSQTNRTEYHNPEISVKDSGSLFKPPAIFCTSDGEQRFDGTVEAGSSWSKELQSPHGTSGTTSTEPDVLQVSSHNVDLNSCSPLSQKLNEGERTPCKMHYPCGNTVTTSEMCVGNLANVVTEVSSSVLGKENSDFSNASQNLSEKEKSESIRKVDIQAMVLTLHNLSELLYYYASTGKCEVREEDRQLLEKATHNLIACSLKDVVLTAKEEELLKSSEVTAQLHVGQQEDLFNGSNEPVKSMSDREENNSGMLSTGVDPQVVKDPYPTQDILDDQILSNGKQQSTATFSTTGTSHTVKDDDAIQAIKEILSQYCHDGHEPDPQVHFLRNLWLEAEAELCFQNCMARFNRLKSKLDASGIKDSPETAFAVERPPIPATSLNFIPEDVVPGTRSLEQNNNIIGSPRSCNYAKVGGVSDVMARFNILKGRSYDPELRKEPTGEEQLLVGAPPPLIIAKYAEADILAEKADRSPRVSHSSVLIDTASCGRNIDDAVMTRFNILTQRDEILNFKPENLASMEAAVGRFEEKMCSTDRDFPAHNWSEALTSSVFKHAESLPPCISESSVMSRWNILKQRDENAVSVENIVHGEMVEVELREEEEPVNGHRARETGCSYPDIMHNNNILSSSSCGEQGTASVLDRLRILKQRDGNQSSKENNFLLQKSDDDLGVAIRADYLSAFRERSAEGSIAKAKYVLQKEASSFADDTAKLESALGARNNSAISSHLKGKASGGWFDITSSDWEHVLKEEVADGATES